MKNYNVHQFTDVNLAQYGYLIRSGTEAAVIDPPRDIRPILKALQEDGLTLKAIIETHPHADFVSGHLELHTYTGATIHTSKLVGAAYDHVGFDNDDSILVGHVTLESLNTPGHSPDSISILLRDEYGSEQVLFSGDTLFVGDVGRPDLREKVGNTKANREKLAGMMYETVQTILKKLPDHVIVYPAHGAGTLCGKALRDAPSTTIGEEKTSNPAFRQISKEAFIAMLTEGQPFIPQYFPYNVSVNRQGAPALQKSLESIPRIDRIPEGMLIVDTRDADRYHKGHVRGALHIAESGLRFETWLGTIVAPDEPFIVIAQDKETLERTLRRIAKIGYEQNVRGAYAGDIGEAQIHMLDMEEFLKSTGDYTIIDVRQSYETESNPVFAQALNIPLDKLRQSFAAIPANKPIAVHCAGGYRSMIAESILSSQFSVPVFDIGERIRNIR